MNNGSLSERRNLRRKQLQEREMENAVLSRQMAEIEKSILELSDRLDLIRKAHNLVTEVANSRRGKLKAKVEAVATEAVRMLFGKEYRVELSYSVKNNRSCLDVELVRKLDGVEVRRDMAGFGGSVADVLSVPLRLMAIVGSKQVDRVCVLDESYKHVDLARVELVGEFLRAIADKLGVQIILVTHHSALIPKCDVRFELVDNAGKVKVIRR